jgi:transposase-like protein
MTERPTPEAIRNAVEEAGSVRGAARQLDIAESTLRGILKRAEADTPAEPAEAVSEPVAGSKRALGIITPKAPQNRPRLHVVPDPPSAEEQRVAANRAQRRRMRRGLAQFRKAFKGILPIGAPSRPMLDPETARMIGEMRRDAGRYARQDQDEARIARIAAERADEAVAA